jgi:D-amino-acid oxidase
LLEAGFRVRIIGARPPLETTSVVAGAVWYPYRAGPPERVRTWGAVTLRELGRLAEEGATGVRWIEGLEVFRAPVAAPAWAADVPGFRPATRAELPARRPAGFSFRVPSVEMSLYLPWLLQRVEASGGSWEIAHLTSLDEAFEHASQVVVCTGLGARELLGDPTLYPIRGQLLHVEGGSTDRFLIDEGENGRFAYVLPRSRDIVLGGTADDGREDLEVSAVESEGILSRCAELVPELARARVERELVGLRPGRPEVRVEIEDLGEGRTLIHNYGHGGAGVTLSWGCADEVCRLVQLTSAVHGKLQGS